MSQQFQIGCIIGSLRKDSFNRQLFNALSKLFPSDFKLKEIPIHTLPLYNQDEDANQPAEVKKLKAAVKESSAIIFFTPEYNRSFSGVIKNAIDHASRPYGQNAWAKKPAGVLGVSLGAIGTAVAQQHLKSVVGYLDMPLVNQPEVYLQYKDGLFDKEGNVGPDSQKFIQTWVDAFVALVKKHAI